MRKLLALLLLAGCGLTPNEVRERGTRADFESARLPLAAAQCITRSAENYRPGIADPFPAHWRDGVKPGEYEVIVRHPVGMGFVWVAEIKPHAAGSYVTTWLTPDLIYREMSDRIVEPCDGRRLTPYPPRQPSPPRTGPRATQ